MLLNMLLRRRRRRREEENNKIIQEGYMAAKSKKDRVAPTWYDYDKQELWYKGYDNEKI